MSSINVIGLAIGLMCSIFLLLYVSDELSYDRFHEKSHRLFRVVTDITSENGQVNRSAYSFAALAPVMRERMAEVESFTRVRVNASSFVRIGEKLFVDERSLAADSSFFDLFTYSFLQGDPETALVRPYTVVLSHSTARRYFGNKNPVGLTINVENSHDLEITAVVEDPPTNTHLRFDFLSSLETYNAQRPGRLDSNWRLLYDYTYVLLAGPHSAEAVEAGLPALTNARLQPLVEQWGNRFRFTLQPLTSIHLGSHREHEIEPGGRYASVYFSAAMAILVLLIACINFVNLSTAQATSRTREAGVRKAIGATRGQLTRQFLTESLVTATIAMLLAVILFVPLLPVFNQLSGKAFSPGNLGSIRVAVSFLVVTLVAGIGGGIYPAFVLSASRPASALRGGPLTGLSRTRVRKTLVAMEFAFAVALMIIALIVYQQLTFMQRAKLGFDRTQVVVLQNDFPSRAATEMETIKNELLRDPAVQNVTLASEWPTRQSDGQLPFRVEGMPFGEGHQMAWYQSDEDYLDVLEMELVSGRNFMPEMASDTAAFLINETAVRQFGLDPGEAVGKRIYVPDGTKPVGFIIGVIRDFQTTSMHEPVRPVLIANYWARPRYILAKIDGKDLSGALNHIEATWAKRMPDTPISIGFLDQQYDALYRSEENLSRVVNTFAALAIFIACLGLVGLSALIARQRTKEVGIRKVLGASVSSIVALLSKDLVQLVAIAFLIAAPIAFLVMQKWLETFANRIDVGAGIFLAAGGLVLSISIVTIGSQAMRAALADPVKSLRYE